MSERRSESKSLLPQSSRGAHPANRKLTFAQRPALWDAGSAEMRQVVQNVCSAAVHSN